MTNEPDRIIVQNRIDFVTGAVRRYVDDVDAVARLGVRAAELLEGKRAAALHHEPGEGEWSASRALGHMIAYLRALRDQVTRMAWMTDPVLPVVDDEAEAEANAWTSQEPERLLASLTEEVEAIEELLKYLPDSSWGRAGLHPGMGRRSIVQHVRGAAAHLGGHLDQVEAALAAQGR
ncbi:MAG: DinB family protein [Chloroflexi bacterium]|nr:DinB family protein [Chloroflexota bacterium]